MTATVAIVTFMRYAGWERGKISAAGVLMTLPALAFTFCVPTIWSAA
jgi:multiple sugar transport system permease protein